MLSRFTGSSQFVARATRPTIITARYNHSEPVAPETVKEKVKAFGKKVNLKVGQGLASAIDSGEHVTKATVEKLEGAKKGADQGKEFVETKTNQGKEFAETKANQGKEFAETKASQGKEFVGAKADQTAEGARKAKSNFNQELGK